jgi:hypothetical protein
LEDRRLTILVALLLTTTRFAIIMANLAAPHESDMRRKYGDVVYELAAEAAVPARNSVLASEVAYLESLKAEHNRMETELEATPRPRPWTPQSARAHYTSTARSCGKLPRTKTCKAALDKQYHCTLQKRLARHDQLTIAVMALAKSMKLQGALVARLRENPTPADCVWPTVEDVIKTLASAATDREGAPVLF